MHLLHFGLQLLLGNTVLLGYLPKCLSLRPAVLYIININAKQLCLLLESFLLALGDFFRAGLLAEPKAQTVGGNRNRAGNNQSSYRQSRIKQILFFHKQFLSFNVNFAFARAIKSFHLLLHPVFIFISFKKPPYKKTVLFVLFVVFARLDSMSSQG